MMEAPILEQPHTIFISVPDTVFNQELFGKSPNDQIEEEALLSSAITTTKEQIIGDESDPLTSSINTQNDPEETQCVIKEEIFIDQDEQHENKNTVSHTKTDVNEQVTAWEETDCDDHHGVPLRESESSSSLLRFLLLTQRDQKNVKQQEYVCEVCNKTFLWCSSFYQHKLMNHCQKSNQNGVFNDNSKPIVTADVDISLAHRNNAMSENAPEDHGNVKKRYVCDVCNREFRWHSSFRRHKLIHNRQLNKQDNICNDNSTDQRKNKKRYVCDLCNKVIRSQRAFCRHKIMHHQQMKSQNDILNDNSRSVVTTEMEVLAQESRMVSEEKTNVCAFIQSGTLAKQKHCEEYKCEECDEAFSEWSLLESHKLVCSDVNYNECEESFANMNDLLEHEVS